MYIKNLWRVALSETKQKNRFKKAKKLTTHGTLHIFACERKLSLSSKNKSEISRQAKITNTCAAECA